MLEKISYYMLVLRHGRERELAMKNHEISLNPKKWEKFCDENFIESPINEIWKKFESEKV